MRSNTATYLMATGEALVVKEAPYTPAGDDDIVVKNHAVALNPVDRAIQTRGQKLFPWLQFPLILGGDVAGEVVEVGSAVTRFQVGDRVVGYAAGLGTPESSRCGCQAYTLLHSNNAARIPSAMSYEQASVLPLTLATATYGLFKKDFLALEYPSTRPKSTGKTLLVWGGATSVGCSAIQLAVAAGYEVIATASPKNFAMVKRLGASAVFDYKEPSITEDLTRIFRGKTCAGAMCVAGVDPQSRQDAADACFEVVGKSEGSKFVALAGQVTKPIPEGVTGKFIMGGDQDSNELMRLIYEDFLPTALEEGTFVPAPEPRVVGHGLESMQTGLEILQNGVSAQKIVVSL